MRKRREEAEKSAPSLRALAPGHVAQRNQSRLLLGRRRWVSAGMSDAGGSALDARGGHALKLIYTSLTSLGF